jgi:hypothetical protein
MPSVLEETDSGAAREQLTTRKVHQSVALTDHLEQETFIAPDSPTGYCEFTFGDRLTSVIDIAAQRASTTFQHLR